MDFSEFSRSFQQVWESKPGTIFLLVLGFAGFLFLVVDTWRHKRRHKRRRKSTQ